MAWKDVAAGPASIARRSPKAAHRPAPRSSCRLTLAPGESKTIVLRLAWYVGQTQPPRGQGRRRPSPARRPARHATGPGMRAASPTSSEVTAYWRRALRRACARKTQRFSDCFYDTTLPPEVIEAVAANLTHPEVAHRAAPGRRPAVGAGKAAATTPAAAPAPARTSGTTPRPSRTSFPRWSGRCARRSSARRRTTAATRSSAARCRSGRWRTTSTPRPTASWAAS